MTLIGPASLIFDGDATDYGDFLTQIQRTTPNPITIEGINVDFSDVPNRGHALVLTGVEQDLTVGTLWRYLYDHRGQREVGVTWSTRGEGVSWQGVIAVVPDPSQGGQANQHGTFNVTIPLKSAPTLVDETAAEWDVTINGSPTGGTWALKVNGAQTAPLAYNANAAAVASAINALSGVTGLGTVSATGSPTITITFPTPVTLSAVSNLTGGTDPSVTVEVSDS